MTDHSPRLYLFTPPLAEDDGFVAPLKAALDAGDIACVLLRLATRDEGTAKKIIKTFGPIVQTGGAALLVEDNARLAIRADTDGVHVRGTGDALDAALETLRPRRIVGAGGLTLRDDAMVAGECGVDYVMFGEPPPAGSLPPRAITIERVAWWSEIFNLPCVGFAADMADAAELAEAGADFIALDEAVWSDPRGPATAVAEAQRLLLAHAKPVN